MKSAVKLLVVAVCLAVGALQALAAYTGPAVTMFYPAENPGSPMELKPTAKAYIYFASGSKIVEVKAAIEQAGQQLGTCVYAGAVNPSTTCTMDPAKPENAAMAQIAEGDFTLKFYEVTYIADGQQVTHSDAAEPFASVTYHRNAANGRIVSETGLADKLIKSYYPVDGSEGVKTYTFSKPVSSSNIHAYLLYGRSDMPEMHAIPSTLTADGLTLTIDLRGMCNNVDHLAPGVVFVDDEGNEVAPPTTITMVIEGLNCVDGTKIATVSTSLDGQHSTNLEGQIYQSYNYEDLTFATPVIAEVKFYDSAAPSTLYADINSATDMIRVIIDHADVIASATLTITNGTTTNTVALTAPIAEPVAMAQAPFVSSDGMVVTLADVVYIQEDGTEHVVLPYEFGGENREILTLADVLGLEADTYCVINVPQGVKVTYVNSGVGYTFIEDATAGLMVATADYSQPLSQGTLVKGVLVGTYMGGGLLLLNVAKSTYTEADIDVSHGTALRTAADVEQLALGAYDNMLLTFDIEDGFAMTPATGEIDITYEGEDIQLPAFTDLFDYQAVEGTITMLTGIVGYDAASQTHYVIVRSQSDIVAEEAGIAGVAADSADGTAYDLHGIRREGTLRPGVYIIDGNKRIIK